MNYLPSIIDNVLCDNKCAFLAGEDMYQMKKLRSELGDIHSILGIIHQDLNASSSLGQY